jgi:hypothetical protein
VKKIKTILLIALTLLIVVILMVKKCRPCEMLCLARTDLLADSSWETNDIVVIFDNGHVWGKDELDTKKFTVIKVPDLSANDARAKYMKPLLSGTTNYKRREYKIDTTKIVITDGQATETKATIEGKLIKKTVAQELPE